MILLCNTSPLYVSVVQSNITFLFIYYICCFVIVNMPTFAVLQVSCENKSTTTHTTQFMVRTEEVCTVFYLNTKFEADSSIRSTILRGSQNFELGPCDQITPI